MDVVIAKVKALILDNGPDAIYAIVIVVVGRMVAKALRNLLARAMQKSKVDETLISFTVNLLYVGMLAFVIIAALGKLGIPTASFVAILGAAGLAVGLALQGSLANFASGVLMIIFKPFKVGDMIEAGGTSGIVEEISIFTTNMRTPDNKQIIVPNGQIMGGTIVNYSAKDTRRVDIVAGVSYSDDLDKVESVLQDIIGKDERILTDPAPTIAVAELADSSVNFVVRPWVNAADYWDVMFALQKDIKQRFDEEGISIPFPQQDIHIIKNE